MICAAVQRTIFSNVLIYASRGNANLDVKVLHAAKTIFDQLFSRSLWDFGHRLRSSELCVEQMKDVGL